MRGKVPAATSVQVLGASLWTYKSSDIVQRVRIKTYPAPWHSVWLPVLFLYTPVHMCCFVFIMSFMLLPASYAMAFWVGSGALYYMITSPGHPEHTGEVCSNLCAQGSQTNPACSLFGGASPRQHLVHLKLHLPATSQLSCIPASSL